jgi:regulator of chromosome condensation
MSPRRSTRTQKLTIKAMANKATTTATKIAKATKASGKPAANSSAKMAAQKKTATKAAATKKTAEPKPGRSTASSLILNLANTNLATTNKVKAEEPAPPVSKKRKAAAKIEDAIEEDDDTAPPAKKSRVVAAPQKVKADPAVKKPKSAAAPKKSKLGPVINEAPSQKLDIYVFGEGSAGELGLGSEKVDGKKPIDVKRPRLNHNLSADAVGVVHIAVGGMHSAALTYDNKILTWGVNDSGALGRDTTWDGGLKDIDDDNSDASSDTDADSKMNPLESTPMAVDSKHFPEGTKIVQLAASDNATFALTADGSVYGWGTFRVSHFIVVFSC